MARALSGVQTCHQAYCKCGWRGATWLGKGSRGNAWGEYNWHKRECPLSTKLEKAHLGYSEPKEHEKAPANDKQS